ncbi:MAG: regulatory signaling modulator protein AmpE [Pseudomonadales bacterium]|nr:regulatory signaling modulator protein AmpE [Pseudomonadales bacterium]
MKFLAILIAIFFYRNWLGDNPVRAVVPFDRYRSVFSRMELSETARYLFCVGLPVLVLWLISLAIADWIAGLLWLIVCVLVLIYGIDIYDEELACDDQLSWLRSLNEDNDLSEAVQKQADFRLRISFEVFQSLHPALFWFLLLGPIGTLIYAVSRDYLEGLDGDDETPELAERVVYWMEWIPVRVTGFIFALLGDFAACFGQWLRTLTDTQTSISDTIECYARFALDESRDYGDDITTFVGAAESETVELRQLLDRTLWGWVGVAAIVVVIGW